MTNDWVSIFQGDVWHVKILQAELDALGITTFVPDYLPMRDPLNSGSPVTELFVLPADVERARTIIAERK